MPWCLMNNKKDIHEQQWLQQIFWGEVIKICLLKNSNPGRLYCLILFRAAFWSGSSWLWRTIWQVAGLIIQTEQELMWTVLWDVSSFNNESNTHSNSFSIKFYWKVQVYRLARWCVQLAILNLRTHLTLQKLKLDRETGKENAIQIPIHISTAMTKFF